MPIFVISLARATTRRENMRARLDKLGADYEIVDAVDGAQLAPADYENHLRRDEFRRKHGRDITNGEIGCFLSHYGLWERIACAKHECALVLEDDAVWGDDFADVIGHVVNCGWEWEVVLLSHFHAQPDALLVCELGGARKLVRHGRYPGITTASYLIRPSGARKLREHCRIIREPLDCMYVRYWRHGAVFYHVDPPPVWQDETPTQVQGGVKIRQSRGDNFRRWLAHRWTRKRERWAHRLYCRTHHPRKAKR